MPVLLFFGAAKGVRHLLPQRDERVAVGFWDARYGEWCENGTGHWVFEEWRGPEARPTHWMPLPEPPAS